MESKTTDVEELFNKLKEYIETTADLFKLKGIKKASGFFSTFAVTVIFSALLFLIIMLASIGFALLIGTWLGKTYYGFFVMAGVFIIIGLVLYSRRNKSVKTTVSDRLIKELFDN
ncbi:MAG TPA: hypothetical protein VIJ95_18920 [Hanamia sp.]